MPQSLHVLNGDATRPEFQKTGIQGDIVIWREMLVDGPAVYPVLSEDWFEARRSFLLKDFSYENQERIEKAQLEFRKLQDTSAYQEVILWFEFDLFCQINMIATLSVLARQNDSQQKIYLICPGEHPEVADFRGLGQLEAGQLAGLYAERELLSEKDLHFADQLYQAYANKDPRSLLPFLEKIFPPVFPYLFSAIQLHLSRFPEKTTGLGSDEKAILNQLREGQASRFKWVGSLLRAGAQEGYGDLQYFHRIKRLEPLFEENGEKVRLNEKGEMVLSGKTNFLDLQREPVSIGGAINTDWVWDNGVLRQRISS